jgi:hypothetical protein
LAIRKQIVMYFSSDPAGPKANLLLYIPASHRGPAPVFLGLNFNGNHSVAADPGIRLNEVWTRQTRQTPDAGTRGNQAQQWQVEKILGRGYALATIYYGDIEPDFNGGIGHGVRPLFFRAGQTEPADDDWGAIGAWAWGLSRAVDYLEKDPGDRREEDCGDGPFPFGKGSSLGGRARYALRHCDLERIG